MENILQSKFNNLLFGFRWIKMPQNETDANTLIGPPNNATVWEILVEFFRVLFDSVVQNHM